MTVVQPGRSPLRHGVPTDVRQQPSMRTVTVSAPVRGLMTEPVAGEPDPATAVVLDNFMVTADGVEPRRGRIIVCRIPLTTADERTEGVGSLFEYTGGVLRDDGSRSAATRYFATSRSALFEFSDATTITGASDMLSAVELHQPPAGVNVTQMASSNQAPVPVAPSYTRTQARYRVAEAYTSGGTFLFAVNGSDAMLRFDGDKWLLLTHLKTGADGSSAYPTDTIADVWVYRNRVFFLQRSSMVAYYHDVNAVHGNAGRIVLHGVFQKGGDLLFGAKWSRDGNDGLDDTCVFGTTNGEVAVYTGHDPGDPVEWQLAGVYDIGVPLGRDCHFNVGGDLLIATKAGLVPLSAAVAKDVTELRLHALTRRISELWDRAAVTTPRDISTVRWHAVKWTNQNAIVVSPQCGSDVEMSCFVANAENGAWSTFSGWGIDTAGILGGDLYIGGSVGYVYRCHRGGRDENGFVGDTNERTYSAVHARLCTQFLSLGAPGQYKIVHGLRGTWRHGPDINPRQSGSRDNVVEFPPFPAPSGTLTGAVEGAVWGEAIWGEAYWAGSGGAHRTYRDFQVVSVHGYTIALQTQITSTGEQALDCSLRRIDVDFSAASAVG